MKMPFKKTPGIVLTMVAVILMGCARGAEFTAPEQVGASHEEVYPRFSNKPRAATVQFSEAEKQSLTNKLDSEATALKKVPGPSANSASKLAKAKDDARREAEETVRQIEQSGKQD